MRTGRIGWRYVVVAAGCGMMALGAVSGTVETTPAARMELRAKGEIRNRDPGIFGDREQVARLDGRPVDVVLVGDSIMHYWEWRHLAKWSALTNGRTVLNLGYAGDRTQHVLWRIEHGELDGFEAKNVVLMIGTNNNSSDDTDPANVAKAIELIIARIRKKQPGAQVILHPIFPRGVSADSKRHAAARARNDRTNVLLKEFATAHPEVTWVDFNDKLVDSTGWVPRTIMADEIHPTDGWRIRSSCTRREPTTPTAPIRASASPWRRPRTSCTGRWTRDGRRRASHSIRMTRSGRSSSGRRRSTAWVDGT